MPDSHIVPTDMVDGPAIAVLDPVGGGQPEPSVVRASDGHIADARLIPVGSQRLLFVDDCAGSGCGLGRRLKNATETTWRSVRGRPPCRHLVPEMYRGIGMEAPQPAPADRLSSSLTGLANHERAMEWGELRTNYGPRRPNSAHINGQPWTPAISGSRSTTVEARSGGQGVASSNLASPTNTLHAIRPSRTCIQPTFLSPSMTPSGGAATSPISRVWCVISPRRYMRPPPIQRRGCESSGPMR